MNQIIALAQVRAQAIGADDILVGMERAVQGAASDAAGLIVFPEYVLNGAGDDVIDEDGEYLRIFQEMAARYRIDIVPGSLLERSDGSLVNATYYIGSDGSILGRYVKVNLWRSEQDRIAQGKHVAVFDTRFGKAGLALCWDLMRPDLFAKMASLGARIVFCPSLWFRGADMPIHMKHGRDTQKMHLDALCRARAIENMLAIVYVNGVGRIKVGDGFDEGIGQSMIALPVRGIVHRMDEESGISFVPIDMSVIDEAREAYGFSSLIVDRSDT